MRKTEVLTPILLGPAPSSRPGASRMRHDADQTHRRAEGYRHSETHAHRGAILVQGGAALVHAGAACVHPGVPRVRPVAPRVQPDVNTLQADVIPFAARCCALAAR